MLGMSQSHSKTGSPLLAAHTLLAHEELEVVALQTAVPKFCHVGQSFRSLVILQDMGWHIGVKSSHMCMY